MLSVTKNKSSLDCFKGFLRLHVYRFKRDDVL